MYRRISTIFLLLLSTGGTYCAAKEEQEEWITILVHGAIGFSRSVTTRTINLIKKDLLEGSGYQKRVSALRNQPYLYSTQPIGTIGLHKVPQNSATIQGAFIYQKLYTDIFNRYFTPEKNTFYTFGWSGLISTKERVKAARRLYLELKQLLKEYADNKKMPKIRIIGYSHGATLLLNFTELRSEFCHDSFQIDESYFVAMPVRQKYVSALEKPPFKKIYTIYSRSDQIQKLDIFTGEGFSRRTFLGPTTADLTQIELRITAPLHRIPCMTLPSAMRGTINQSPGHIELWSYGWTKSLYRKNIQLYPACGAVLIPYLVYAAQQLPSTNVQVDIRPEEEQSIVLSLCGPGECTVPFLTRTEFYHFIKTAYLYHPSTKKFQESFIESQNNFTNLSHE